MHLRADRKQLLDAAKAVRVAAGSGSISVIEGMRLEGRESGLHLACTNIDLTIEATLEEVKQEGPGPFLAIPPAARFTSFLNALDGDVVDLDLAGDDLTIASGSATAVMRCYRDELWPNLATLDDAPVRLSAEDLDRIERIMFAASSDKARVHLCCVHFEGRHAWTTDSYRIGRADLSVEVPTVNVPVPVLTAVTKGALADGVDFAATDNLVRFATGARTWTSTVIPGSIEYPKLQMMVDGLKLVRHVTVGAEALRSALARARVVDGDLHFVTVQLDGSALRVTNATTDIGETAEEIAAEGDLAEPVGFNSAYLADAIDAHDSPDFEMRFGDTPLKPVFVEGDGVAQLLQPIRLGVKV